MSKVPKPLKPADGFAHVIELIQVARGRAYQATNTALIDLYWQIGEHISRKIAATEWGDGVVEQLARHIPRRSPGYAVSPGPTCFGCDSFMRPTRAMQKSRHC